MYCFCRIPVYRLVGCKFTFPPHYDIVSFESSPLDFAFGDLSKGLILMWLMNTFIFKLNMVSEHFYIQVTSWTIFLCGNWIAIPKIQNQTKEHILSRVSPNTTLPHHCGVEGFSQHEPLRFCFGHLPNGLILM